jgi:two-component system sensor histidine kinase KdpD
VGCVGRHQRRKRRLHFHLPPTGRLTIAHSENVVALIVFFIAAVVASSLADLVRARTGRPRLRRRGPT